MGLNPKYKFQKRLLASTVAAAVVGMSHVSTVSAQEGQVEEVLVTGIRASVQRAMDIKRDASGVVDAISAEDIGKMPDQNLAESLQRITGLSISRNNGEGSKVTVRGIDEDMNMVTLNGRVLPAVTNGGFGDDASRAFDFGNIASEGIFGVEVYKSGRSDLATGGLGATIDVKTLRPLDAGEVKTTVGLKAVNDTTARSGAGKEITPEISGLFSWVNDEDTFGVSLTGSYQERDSSQAYASVVAWNQNTWDSATSVPGTTTVINEPTDGDIIYWPTDLRYSVRDNSRIRTNGQLTIQFRPVETVTATVDYTYAENKLTSDRNEQSTWFNNSAIEEVTFDSDVVKTPVIYSEVYPGSFKDVAFGQMLYVGGSQLDSVGLNVEWDVSDNLVVELDFHDSRAYNQGNAQEPGIAAQVAIREYADFRYDLPVLSYTVGDGDPDSQHDLVNNTTGVQGADGLIDVDVNGDPIIYGAAATHSRAYDAGNGNSIVDPGDITTTMGQFYHGQQTTEIQQVRLSGEYSFDALGVFEESSVKAGIEKRDDSNLTKTGFTRVTMGNWGGVDPGRFDDHFFRPIDFAAAFDDYSSTFADPNVSSIGVEANTFDIIALAEAEYLAAADGSIVGDGSNFNGFSNHRAAWNREFNLNRLIEEEVTSFYAQFRGSFDLSGMEANLGVGFRYEATDITSTSNVQSPERLRWEDNNDWSTELADAPTNYSVEHDYNNFLPSIDFDLMVTDDVKVRASYSTTMARAGYGDLRSEVAIESIYLRTANGGNPELEPMESDNLDLSVEWYYADSSYASFGFFRKDVSNFIGSSGGEERRSHYGLRDARLGPRALAVDPTIDPNVHTLPNGTLSETDLFVGMGGVPGANPLYANSDDPLIQWATSLPVNDEDAVIDGFEIGVQHWFGETGFGVQANYTAVDADVEFDISVVGEPQFAMEGLSDTANLIGFFERDGWQVRVAYNWRDEFLNSRNVGANEPEHTEEFAQIDFTVGYEFNDNLSVTVEGLNVTGENARRFQRTKPQLRSLEDLGPRYAAGIRYNF